MGKRTIGSTMPAQLNGAASNNTALPSRLQIATRIHQLLLRELGQGVAVEMLLTRERYARDVLLVCDALRGSELAQLADDFRRLTAQQRQAAAPRAAPRSPPSSLPAALAQRPPGHVLQPTDWSADTSGFSVSQLPARQAAAPAPDLPERRAGWLRRWRGG